MNYEEHKERRFDFVRAMLGNAPWRRGMPVISAPAIVDVAERLLAELEKREAAEWAALQPSPKPIDGTLYMKGGPFVSCALRDRFDRQARAIRDAAREAGS